MAIAIPSSEQDILGIFNSLGSIAGPGGSLAGQPISAPAAFASPQQIAVPEPQPISRTPAFQSPQAGGATVGGGKLQAGAAGKDTGSLADRVPKFKFAQFAQLGGAGGGSSSAGTGVGSAPGTNSGAHAAKAGAGIKAAAVGIEAGIAASAGGAALGAAIGEGALAAIMLLL